MSIQPAVQVGVHMWYNTGVNYIKSDGALERNRHPFSTDVKGIDTMTHSTRTPYFPENLQDYAPWVTTCGLTAPYGECQCGCGQKTNICKHTFAKAGHKLGHPYPLCKGHTRKHPRTPFPDDWSDPSGKTRAIPLSKGKIAIVDAADYEWLMQWKWCAWKSHKVFYAVRSFRISDGVKGFVYMHREILGVSDGELVDHRDCDGLNNTRQNLRIATSQQNCRNHQGKRNHSGFKGVSLSRTKKRWVAQIKFDGKQRNLGSYATAEEAARVYDAAALKHFGEFAWTNFPKESYE